MLVYNSKKWLRFVQNVQLLLVGELVSVRLLRRSRAVGRHVGRGWHKLRRVGHQRHGCVRRRVVDGETKVTNSICRPQNCRVSKCIVTVTTQSRREPRVPADAVLLAFQLVLLRSKRKRRTGIGRLGTHGRHCAAVTCLADDAELVSKDGVVKVVVVISRGVYVAVVGAVSKSATRNTNSL